MYPACGYWYPRGLPLRKVPKDDPSAAAWTWVSPGPSVVVQPMWNSRGRESQVVGDCTACELVEADLEGRVAVVKGWLACLPGRDAGALGEKMLVDGCGAYMGW